MSFTHDPEDIYYAAKKLQPYLPASLQTSLNVLMQKAAAGEDTANQILYQLTDDPDTRAWLDKALPRYQDDQIMIRGHTPVGGDVGNVPASGLLVCPEEGCQFEYLMRHAGQRVKCPQHKVNLVPVDQKQGG